MYENTPPDTTVITVRAVDADAGVYGKVIYISKQLYRVLSFDPRASCFDRQKTRDEYAVYFICTVLLPTGDLNN